MCTGVVYSLGVMQSGIELANIGLGMCFSLLKKGWLRGSGQREEAAPEETFKHLRYRLLCFLCLCAFLQCRSHILCFSPQTGCVRRNSRQCCTCLLKLLGILFHKDSFFYVVTVSSNIHFTIETSMTNIHTESKPDF